MNGRRYPAHDLGAWGEATAARFLTASGWAIEARGYRLGRREIDLVASRDGLLAFVEVKTRSGTGFGGPAAAITWKKRREIEAVARAWLQRYGAPVRGVRFDVVAIVTDRARRIVHCDHIEDAWRPESDGKGYY